MTDEITWYGEPDPQELAVPATRFLQIAATAHERFSALPAYDTDIQLIPLEQGGKRPAAGFLPSRHAVPKSREALAVLACAYPNANVGINSRRAVGGLFVIDCDEPGVEARIERETGRKLPLTYTTLTRPQSKPHKRHICYMSTEYSVGQVRKQVMDVTRITGYDLKGCGGGYGYVATQGCVRDGEAIVVLHDAPIAPMPDWLVDWLVADVAKARSRKRELAAKKHDAETPSPAQTDPAPPGPFAVPRLRRTFAIRSRIRTWKNTGMSDEEIMSLLVAHIRAHFEDGDRMLTTDGMRKLRAMVREVPTLGARAYSNLLRDRHHRHKRRFHRMREHLETAPDQLASAEARRLLDVHTHADEQRMCRQLRRARYVVTGQQGSHHRVWVRLRPVPQSSSPDTLRSLSSYRAVSSLSSHRAGRAHAAATATSSESKSESFYTSQVFARKEVADGALTLTFAKDGRSRMCPHRIRIRAVGGSLAASERTAAAKRGDAA